MSIYMKTMGLVAIVLVLLMTGCTIAEDSQHQENLEDTIDTLEEQVDDLEDQLTQSEASYEQLDVENNQQLLTITLERDEWMDKAKTLASALEALNEQEPASSPLSLDSLTLRSCAVSHDLYNTEQGPQYAAVLYDQDIPYVLVTNDALETRTLGAYDTFSYPTRVDFSPSNDYLMVAHGFSAVTSLHVYTLENDDLITSLSYGYNPHGYDLNWLTNDIVVYTEVDLNGETDKGFLQRIVLEDLLTQEKIYLTEDTGDQYYELYRMTDVATLDVYIADPENYGQVTQLEEIDLMPYMD